MLFLTEMFCFIMLNICATSSLHHSTSYWYMRNVCTFIRVSVWRCSLPRIWAKGVVHPSCLLPVGGSECPPNCQCCSETQSRQCHCGWQSNILKWHISVHNEQTAKWKIYCDFEPLRLWIYLKCSGPCRLQNVASLAKASWICKEEYRVAAWFSIFSVVSKVGQGALRQ